MSLTKNQIKQFFDRIDRLTRSQKPLFGKMNANQMICHCADFFRMAKGTKMALEYNTANSDEIIALAKSRKTVPTPKGFGQIEGQGTQPTNFDNDKEVLKNFISEFANFDEAFEFAEHPYFGKMTRKEWDNLAAYHLNHHLKQFNV